MGGSRQRAPRLVNNGVHGFVLLVRLQAVPHWPPGLSKILLSSFNLYNWVSLDNLIKNWGAFVYMF